MAFFSASLAAGVAATAACGCVALAALALRPRDHAVGRWWWKQASSASSRSRSDTALRRLQATLCVTLLLAVVGGAWQLLRRFQGATRETHTAAPVPANAFGVHPALLMLGCVLLGFFVGRARRFNAPAADTAHARTLSARLHAALELLSDLLPGHVVDELLQYDTSQSQQKQEHQEQQEQEQCAPDGFWYAQQPRTAPLDSPPPRRFANPFLAYGTDSPVFSEGGADTATTHFAAARQLSISSRQSSYTSYNSARAERAAPSAADHSASFGGGGGSSRWGCSPAGSSNGLGMYDPWLSGFDRSSGGSAAAVLAAAAAAEPCAMCSASAAAGGGGSSSGGVWLCPRCRPAADSAAAAAADDGTSPPPLPASSSLPLLTRFHHADKRPTVSGSSCSAGSVAASASAPGTRSGFVSGDATECVTSRDDSSGSTSGAGSGSGFLPSMPPAATSGASSGSGRSGSRLLSAVTPDASAGACGSTSGGSTGGGNGGGGAKVSLMSLAPGMAAAEAFYADRVRQGRSVSLHSIPSCGALESPVSTNAPPTHAGAVAAGATVRRGGGEESGTARAQPVQRKLFLPSSPTGSDGTLGDDAALLLLERPQPKVTPAPAQDRLAACLAEQLPERPPPLAAPLLDPPPQPSWSAFDSPVPHSARSKPPPGPPSRTHAVVAAAAAAAVARGPPCADADDTPAAAATGAPASLARVSAAAAAPRARVKPPPPPARWSANGGGPATAAAPLSADGGSEGHASAGSMVHSPAASRRTSGAVDRNVMMPTFSGMASFGIAPAMPSSPRAGTESSSGVRPFVADAVSSGGPSPTMIPSPHAPPPPAPRAGQRAPSPLAPGASALGGATTPGGGGGGCGRERGDAVAVPLSTEALVLAAFLSNSLTLPEGAGSSAEILTAELRSTAERPLSGVSKGGATSSSVPSGGGGRLTRSSSDTAAFGCTLSLTGMADGGSLAAATTATTTTAQGLDGRSGGGAFESGILAAFARDAARVAAAPSVAAALRTAEPPHGAAATPLAPPPPQPLPRETGLRRVKTSITELFSLVGLSSSDAASNPAGGAPAPAAAARGASNRAEEVRQTRGAPTWQSQCSSSLPSGRSPQCSWSGIAHGPGAAADPWTTMGAGAGAHVHVYEQGGAPLVPTTVARAAAVTAAAQQQQQLQQQLQQQQQVQVGARGGSSRFWRKHSLSLSMPPARSVSAAVPVAASATRGTEPPPLLTLPVSMYGSASGATADQMPTSPPGGTGRTGGGSWWPSAPTALLPSPTPSEASSAAAAWALPPPPPPLPPLRSPLSSPPPPPSKSSPLAAAAMSVVPYMVPSFVRRSMSVCSLNAVDGLVEPPEVQQPPASMLWCRTLAATQASMGGSASSRVGSTVGILPSSNRSSMYARASLCVDSPRHRAGVAAGGAAAAAAQRLSGPGGIVEEAQHEQGLMGGRPRRVPRSSTGLLYSSAGAAGSGSNASCSEAGARGGAASMLCSGFGGVRDMPYAEWHPCVSVLFADVCGFTSISDRVPAVAVMEMLNALYCRLDALCANWGQHAGASSSSFGHQQPPPPVYKVQIIGDAYMVATGLLADDPAHAATACCFALAVQREAAQVLDPCDGQPLRLRVGIHSGPVVSGVVGRMRRQYSVFGDTVNVASRMESTGAPGAIHVSEDTHRLALPYMPPGSCVWRRRTGVEVKGKGTMDTYWLEEAPAPVPALQLQQQQQLLMQQLQQEQASAASDAALATSIASRYAESERERGSGPHSSQQLERLPAMGTGSLRRQQPLSEEEELDMEMD